MAYDESRDISPTRENQREPINMTNACVISQDDICHNILR